MKNYKYLDDLGIDKEDQFLNWIYSMDEDDRSEYWKEQREIYGIDERETWNWGTEFMDYCYIHLRMYGECAPKIVDLTYHKVDFRGEKISLFEAINIIIYWFNNIYYKTNRGNNLTELGDNREEILKRIEEYNNSYRETMYLLMDIMPYLWW